MAVSNKFVRCLTSPAATPTPRSRHARRGMADEEVDFEEAVDLGDAPMEESAGSGKKGRDATGRRLAIHTLCLPWLHFLLR